MRRAVASHKMQSFRDTEETWAVIRKLPLNLTYVPGTPRAMPHRYTNLHFPHPKQPILFIFPHNQPTFMALFFPFCFLFVFFFFFFSFSSFFFLF
jgi:hypothetical protein